LVAIPLCCNETVGNLSHLPDEVVELVRLALGGERFCGFRRAYNASNTISLAPANSASPDRRYTRAACVAARHPVTGRDKTRPAPARDL